MRELWLRSIEIDDDTYEFDIVPDADDVVKRDTERDRQNEGGGERDAKLVRDRIDWHKMLQR